MVWLTIGAAMLPKSDPVYLPTSTNQCTNDTFNEYVVAHRLSEMSIKQVRDSSTPVTNITSFVNSQKYISPDG